MENLVREGAKGHSPGACIEAASRSASACCRKRSGSERPTAAVVSVPRQRGVSVIKAGAKHCPELLMVEE